MTPLNIPGIANGWKVDDIIWRGAQPEDSAWPLLAAAGCRTVIDLNTVGNKAIQRQADLVMAVGDDYIHNYYPACWSGILPPNQERIEAALGVLDSYPGPAFIHCQHGSDRTGTLCAIWRMHHDGWSFETAMEEAFTSLGFNGMHEFWMAAAVAQYAADRGRNNP